MPIDFFSFPCSNPAGNCQTKAIQCLRPFSNNKFGVSDANANLRTPANVMFSEPAKWDFLIENPNNKKIKNKAIDYCIDIFRTGTYDVDDDDSNAADFSSDNRGTEIIKRCEGFLFEEEKWILFFEIKNRLYGNWLIDARKKFEETILSFKEHHPDRKHLIIEPIVSNKLFYRVHQSEMIQKRILKDKIGVEFKVQKSFIIE